MIVHAGAQMAGRLIVDANATGQRLNELCELWKRERGNKSLPSRTAFHFRSLRPWLGHIALVEVSHNPIRFRYRLFGTHLSEWSGVDYTGRSFEQAYNSQSIGRILVPFDECLRTQAPVSTRQSYRSALGPTVFLDQLLLPCSDVDHRVEMIVGACYLRADETASA